MKRAISILMVLILTVFIFHSCGKNHRYYKVETDLGDTFTLEVYLAGNLHGMWPRYLIYDGDDSVGKKNGCILYIDKDESKEGKMPADPVNDITTVGAYGDYHFYKVLDWLFYYQKGVYMSLMADSLEVDKYESYKENSNVPNDIAHDVQAMSDLMKSQNFEYIHKYGEILASDKDPYLREMLVRYSNGDFSDEERRINAESSITEADMTLFAQCILRAYYVD